jgi:hypothetical protein
MRILRVRLAAAEGTRKALRCFYADQLGFPMIGEGHSHRFGVGDACLEFSPTSEREPFYHFALRVPRNRFSVACEWLARHAELLSKPGSDETTFEFPNWNAEACYAHDPGGNIVELIAHHELPEEGSRTGSFTAAEILGVCEVGLVGSDTRVMATSLETLGVRLWDGSLDVSGRLAFMGAADGTLILAATGRGWMPTGRAAELFEVSVDVAGAQDAEVTVLGTPHRVRTVVSR